MVFFGACGSLSDAAMDFAVQSGAQHILCRTCCHDNIGGNTVIVKRPSTINRLFRLKNLIHQTWTHHVPGHYFSSQYTWHDYPRSQAAGKLSHSGEFLEICQHSVDSDICRALIDLDRSLYLAEHGYQVWTKGELIVAVNTQSPMTIDKHG
ncbi:MAG: SAM-dependent methyltransferase [Phycisphaerae bacterium]|nr:SAM-dependent methyltransferase [Phycisphaerae bacterium]